GLMRGREFLMKDAYSFHVDVEDARREYRNMFDTYGRIFERCGLTFRPVEAGTGTIGGSLSHEFQVLASSGEDAIVSCDRCGYAANVEKAEVRPLAAPAGGAGGPLERVATPGRRTVEEVSAFLGLPPERFVKTLLYRTAGDATVAVLVRGDHEVSETKLQAALGGEPVALADEDTVTRATGAPVGFAGPGGLGVRILADASLRGMRGAVSGANRALVVPVGARDGALGETAARLAAELEAAGVDTLLDDRDERPGVKFKDADLIGLPVRLTVGPRALARGAVELKRRSEQEATEVPVAEAAARAAALVGPR